MDAIHRILSGQALTARELRLAGILVAIWFLMDFVQWVDWLAGKFSAEKSPVVIIQRETDHAR